jgi:hypothetical protein
MTWRTWMWRGPFLAWFMVMAAPMLVLFIPINLADDQSPAERLIGNLVLVGAFLLLVLMHNWINVKPGKVWLGFFPMYWKTIAVREVRCAISTEFSPTRDFSGWRIKGKAKSPNRILPGGNPSRGIMIETLDRQRYSLSFVDAEPILSAIAAQGCVITSDHGDDSASGP